MPVHSTMGGNWIETDRQGMMDRGGWRSEQKEKMRWMDMWKNTRAVGYLKLEIIPLNCKLPRQNMTSYSSKLHLNSP